MIDTNNIRNYNVADLIGKNIECPCGQTHNIATKNIFCEENALKNLAPLLAEYNAQKILVVSADDIYEKITLNILKILKQNHIIFDTHIFKANFHPTLEIANDLAAKVEIYDICLSIGSGCVTDCSKYYCNIKKIPLISIATAPSMDGYLSVNSVIVVDGIKTPLPTTAPQAIIFDSSIMRAAPKRMIAAGFGDVASKYLSILDWKIANIFTGEFYCDTIANMTLGAADLSIVAAQKILNNDDSGYLDLTESLIRSSVAMQLLKSTRCASGGEHSSAHVIGMYNTANAKKEFMHGEEVLIAFAKLVPLYKAFFQDDDFKFNKKDIQDLLVNSLKLSTLQANSLIEEYRKLNENNSNQEVFQKIKEFFFIEISKIEECTPLIKSLYASLTDRNCAAQFDVLSEKEIDNCISLAPIIKQRYTTLTLMMNVNSQKH